MDDPALPAGARTSFARLAHLILAAVIALAFIGFFVGLKQGKTIPELTPPQSGKFEEFPDAVAATPYRDFDQRKVGPNRTWKNSLANLQQPAIDLFRRPERSEETRLVALSHRAKRRAFDGAPPVVPHPIDQTGTASCLACHGEGLMIGKGVWAPKMSHAMLIGCTQCHVEQQSAALEPLPHPENQFQAFRATSSGSRAWPGAPPTMPHAVFMREQCMSCHGPTGADPIRTSHPYRASCQQCHAPSAALDQRPPGDEGPAQPAANPNESN
jgi:cytochrome c-type protein NapB